MASLSVGESSVVAKVPLVAGFIQRGAEASQTRAQDSGVQRIEESAPFPTNWYVKSQIVVNAVTEHLKAKTIVHKLNILISSTITTQMEFTLQAFSLSYFRLCDVTYAVSSSGVVRPYQIVVSRHPSVVNHFGVFLQFTVTVPYGPWRLPIPELQKGRVSTIAKQCRYGHRCLLR